MITIDDLKAAIAECEGERNPNANTCCKLAAYYTILREKQGEPEKPSYSNSSEPVSLAREYSSPTEFGQAIQGKDTLSVLEVMDELVTLLEGIQPQIYKGVMRKLNQI